MRTTLNIPDPLIKEAKRRAIDEGKTLTDLLMNGLRIRLSRSLPARLLPLSRAGGGLVPGVDWSSFGPAEPAQELYR